MTGQRSMLYPVWRVWEHLLLYLPIIIMGLLALGSWWLVRNAPQPVEPVLQQKPQHEPDYFMRHFSVTHFDDTGRMKSEMHGSLMRHYLDTHLLEIDQVRLHTVNAQGHIITASARQALSNDNGTEIQLRGNAVVTHEAAPTANYQPPQPPLEFRGEFLHIWINEERLRSNQPVILTRGNDTLSANSMDYDHTTQTLRMQGRVRGTLLHRQ